MYLRNWSKIFEDWSIFWVSNDYYYPDLSSYSLPYTMSVWYNNNEIEKEADGTINWDMWSETNYKEAGVFDVVCSANWKKDDAAAVVSATMHFDTNNEDYIAPQVTLWQPRDNSGVNSVLNSESRIIFTCLENSEEDFSAEVLCPEIEDYTFKTVKVREVPFWDSNWQIRRSYTIDLSDFPGEEGKKYSLEFNLADASGNTCTQTIGHAFEWSKSTGIEAAVAENGIRVVNGHLQAPADARVYTIDGRLADRNTLAKGIYIVKTANNVTKIAVR